MQSVWTWANTRRSHMSVIGSGGALCLLRQLVEQNLCFLEVRHIEFPAPRTILSSSAPVLAQSRSAIPLRSAPLYPAMLRRVPGHCADGQPPLDWPSALALDPGA